MKQVSKQVIRPETFGVRSDRLESRAGTEK